MPEECDFKGFLKRVLYKVSGLKIIGFVISTVAVFAVLFVCHVWKGFSETLATRAISAIETLALGLIGAKLIQNVVGIVKGNSNTNNNNGN